MNPFPLDDAEPPELLRLAPPDRTAIVQALLEARGNLERARWLEQQTAPLPAGSHLPGTQRLLADSRRLWERWVRYFETALQTLEDARPDR